MSRTVYLANAELNQFFRGTAYSYPSTLYCALFVSGVEVTGGNYARVAVAVSTSNFSASTSASLTTLVDIPFNTPSAGWGVVNGFKWFDALTSGNALRGGSVSPPINVQAGSPVRFPAGSLTTSETTI